MTIALMLLSAMVQSSPDLGKAAGRCAPHEDGPSFLVDVIGLKDRRGLLKLELYPANDHDLLADDNVLVNEGKPFARVEGPIAPAGPITLCIRAPGPGTYALSLLHDRNQDRKFTLSSDGIGFSGNPKLRWSKPAAADVQVAVGMDPVRLPIRLNYRNGLFSVAPLKD